MSQAWTIGGQIHPAKIADASVHADFGRQGAGVQTNFDLDRSLSNSGSHVTGLVNFNRNVRFHAVWVIYFSPLVKASATENYDSPAQNVIYFAGSAGLKAVLFRLKPSIQSRLRLPRHAWQFKSSTNPRAMPIPSRFNAAAAESAIKVLKSSAGSTFVIS